MHISVRDGVVMGHTGIQSEIRKILFSTLTLRAHARWMPLMGGGGPKELVVMEVMTPLVCVREGVVVGLEAVEEIGDGAATTLICSVRGRERLAHPTGLCVV